MQRRRGIHRTLRKRNRSTRRSTRSKRIICNKRTRRNKRTKGGNYDKDVTTNTRELVPIKSKGVVVAMPGYVFSAREYDDHMEYMDRQGSS